MHEKTDRHTGAIHDEPVGTMGRRRFMDTLRSLGFGALSAALLTADDVRAASDDEVPIVYGLARDGGGDESGGGESGGGESGGGDLRPRRKTVPADWYDDFRDALDAHRRLVPLDAEGVANSAVEPGEYGGSNAAIRVEVTGEEARGAVPEAVEQVPVEVTRVEPGDRDTAGERDSDSADREQESVPSGVPGSVAIASDDLYGTLAPAMRDPADGSAYFATSNHLYDGSHNGGKPLYLVGEGKARIGTVERGFPKADLVCAAPEDDFEPLHSIRDTSPGRVLGQFTRAGLADLKAADEPLEKVGVKTGHTQGTIQAVDGLTCAYGAVCKRGQLKWGRESAFSDGDSGSVNFHADPDNPEAGVLVGGLNNARTWWPGENYVWGTAAHHITEQYGYTF